MVTSGCAPRAVRDGWKAAADQKEADGDAYGLAQAPDEHVRQPHSTAQPQAAEDGDVSALEGTERCGDEEARELDRRAERFDDRGGDQRGVDVQAEQKEVDLEATSCPRSAVQERGADQRALALA